MKPYRLLFLAGVLSEFGTYVSEVAIIMRIYEISGGRVSFLGLTQGIFLLAMIVGTLLGGVWGEGRGKARLLLLCEIARVPILATMLLHEHSLFTLMLGTGGVAFFSGLFNPTRQALVNELLPVRLLPQANGVSSGTFAFLHAAGPLLGGLWYGLRANLRSILCFDLFTYGIGIFLILKLKAQPAVASGGATPAPKEEANFWADLQSGFALLRGHPAFFWIVLRCLLANAALGIVIPLMLPLTQEVFHLPEYGYGLLLGTFGLGGALGGLAGPRAFKGLPVERSLQLFFGAEVLSLLAWTLIPIPAWSFVIAFVYGATLFARIGSQLTYVSLRLPSSFSARANSILDLASVVPNFAGAALVACLGSTLGTEGLLRATAFGCAAAASFLCLVENRERR